jgi:hypothetical protein
VLVPPLDAEAFAAPVAEASDLGNRLIAEIERRRVPGAVVAIVHDGETERFVNLGLGRRRAIRAPD